MARILAVHGVGQQFNGEAIIQDKWWLALRSGLSLADHELPDSPIELSCAFYGHLFRKPGALAFTENYRAEDVAGEESVLLELFWQAAAAAEPTSVPAPQEYDEASTLARAPQIIQRALNALSQSSFWGGLSQSALIGDLKQVVRYLNDPDVHESVLKIVVDKISPETKVVIGHSLGSVVAYEAVCCKPENVVSFVSLGSPLGIRNLIFDKLTPRPNAMAIGRWPGKVKSWTNIAEKGDIVALEKNLVQRFGTGVKDVLVNNGSDPHSGERYLTTAEAGLAVAKGLW